MNKYKVAMYLRISKEDNKNFESESIINQKNMIKAFINEKDDLELVSIKIDDGYSGSNFNRPAFQSMLDEVKNGVINCIIVKDFSRLGRNFIDCVKYIEKIFPMLNVRFISINDNYDSLEENQENSLIIPFKNLINDAYIKDIAMKIKSQKIMKMKNGEFIGAFTTYGYLKDLEHKGKLIVDEFASEVVKEIFRLKIKGYSAQKIADKLNENGILSPMDYKKYIGINFSTSFKKNDKSKWSTISIIRILKNNIYTGDLEQGKTTTINHKINLKLTKDKKDWYVIENNHTPIISKEDFNLVQRLLNKNTRVSPKKDLIYSFSGLVFCKDCGRSMIRKNCGTKINPNYNLICSGYKNGNKCTSHIIKYNILEQFILIYIKNYIKDTVNIENILENIYKTPLKNSKIKSLNETKQIKENELEIYKKYKFRIYQDYQENLLTKSEFLDYSKKYDLYIKETINTIKKLNEEINNICNNNFNNNDFIENFKKHKNITTLDRAFIVNIIHKIEILNNKTINIYFKFQEKFIEKLNENFIDYKDEVKFILRSTINE
ncbi:recombinase family protein [[Clostridium] colinum]|uniref:recombinase family protein n=1 Tax=[Clostridium] colinum TaxID=36835 RepID=UPI002025AC70|nr:recombinase family protein [[Clostridium] colinum]